MILMRMNKVVGDCQIAPYHEKAGQPGGWFPIDSFNFGVPQKSKSAQTNTTSNDQTSTNARGTSSRQSTAAGQQAGQQSGAGTNGDEAEGSDFFEKMEIVRKVDRSTVHLMKLAMQALANPGQDLESSSISVDIHIVGSMRTGESNVFTWLRIRLERVHVTDWKVSASGDGRPSETVSLRYGRAAMSYHGTPDGLILDTPIDDGWDQLEPDPERRRWRYFLTG